MRNGAKALAYISAGSAAMAAVFSGFVTYMTAGLEGRITTDIALKQEETRSAIAQLHDATTRDLAKTDADLRRSELFAEVIAGLEKADTQEQKIKSSQALLALWPLFSSGEERRIIVLAALQIGNADIVIQLNLVGEELDKKVSAAIQKARRSSDEITSTAATKVQAAILDDEIRRLAEFLKRLSGAAPPNCLLNNSLPGELVGSDQLDPQNLEILVNTYARYREHCEQLIAIQASVEAALAVANFYQPYIGKFAKAAKNLEYALGVLDKQMTEALVAELRNRTLGREGFLKYRNGDCQSSSARCRLVVVDQSGQEELLSPSSLLPNMLAVMQSIRRYADGLKAIVDVVPASQVAIQDNATLVSVENLADAVAKISGSTTAARKTGNYGTPFGQAVGWLAGQYVAPKSQIDALRRATREARPVIEGVATLFETFSEISMVVQNVRFANNVDARFQVFDESATESSLENLIESANRYHQFLTTEPSLIFKALRTAHSALAQHLNNEDLSRSNVIGKIKAFATAAETWANALKGEFASKDESEN
ncbi:MAG: hypothetical protein O7F17_09535 [Planctomycetota bacterium]|nr:hypothetical protein [Planctomycetota bacterium]